MGGGAFDPQGGRRTLCPVREHDTVAKHARPVAQSAGVPWEAQRPRCEATLRHQEAIPSEAVAMAVSLDGVMAPMQDGQRQAKRTHARTMGKAPSGPAGSQEVGGATVS